MSTSWFSNRERDPDRKIYLGLRNPVRAEPPKDIPNVAPQYAPATIPNVNIHQFPQDFKSWALGEITIEPIETHGGVVNTAVAHMRQVNHSPDGASATEGMVVTARDLYNAGHPDAKAITAALVKHYIEETSSPVKISTEPKIGAMLSELVSEGTKPAAPARRSPEGFAVLPPGKGGAVTAERKVPPRPGGGGMKRPDIRAPTS